MLVSQERILEEAIAALESMAQRKDVPKDVVADTQVIALLLRHTRHIDHGGESVMREHCGRAVVLLRELHGAARAAAPSIDVDAQFEALIGHGLAVQSSAAHSTRLKAEFLEFARHLDEQLGALARRSDAAWGRLMAELAPQWLAWQTSFDALGAPGAARSLATQASAELTVDSLQRYMRDKLGDPGASVENLIVLPGGFGKETSLFSVRSQGFNGDLVMRRDLPVPILEGLDCHAVKQEFPLLKAIYARDFPVAEPLWFESGCAAIPGADFIVVRKAAGDVLGNAMGGRDQVAANLRQELATTTARIHALPALKELGEDNPALGSSLWQKTAQECTAIYVKYWYDYYLDTPHMPLPALHNLFNWLLANVPASDAAPTLVHGDIGFHNLLIADGRLSSVLDWEFAHIGDPAEDIGYIKSGVGNQLDWPKFLAEYAQAGGTIPDPRRVLYYEIWAHVRNAASSASVMDLFESGRLPFIRYGILPYRYVPHFIARAEALIAEWDAR